MDHPLAMLPFCFSEDIPYGMIPNPPLPGSARDMSILQSHPKLYHGYLYSEILEANTRQEQSLRDLPVELIAEILAMVPSSSPRTGVALALASPWISDLTLATRLAHVSLRSYKAISSFQRLLCSSIRAAGAVRTLWIPDSIGPVLNESGIPAILRACTNLRALACHMEPLEPLLLSRESFPLHLLSVQFTMTEFVGMPWNSPISKWTRMMRTPHGAGLLSNLTHLRLVHHHYQLETFPAQNFPRLTHIAIGSERDWSRNPAEYPSHIRAFAQSLEHLWTATSLQLAVLVFRVYSRHAYRPQPPRIWQARELVRAARDYGSNILVYCVPDTAFRESKFWDECVANGDDIWTLAQKQISLLSKD
ncbi:hypothetical protein DFH06DRAFT_218790 [Mycena polygramma]|nr:hypothetical protein DFH06DRAFT_218790 [Mycena polygramma]